MDSGFRDFVEAVERHLGENYVRPLFWVTYLGFLGGSALAVFMFLRTIFKPLAGQENWETLVAIVASVTVGHLVGILVSRTLFDAGWMPKSFKERQARMDDQMEQAKEINAAFREQLQQVRALQCCIESCQSWS